MELALAWSHDVVDVGESEGHEEQPRLVDVPVVLVDHGDGSCVGGIGTTEPVGGEGAAGAASEDHDVRVHATSTTGFRGVEVGTKVPSYRVL